MGVTVSLAICTLLISLTPATAQDYVFATMFLICSSSFLKIRWLLGTAVLSLPLLATHLSGKVQQMPREAPVHLFIAWAVGGLMSFLADSYRRCGSHASNGTTLWLPLCQGTQHENITCLDGLMDDSCSSRRAFQNLGTHLLIFPHSRESLVLPPFMKGSGRTIFNTVVVPDCV